ncbi:MAG: ImmA/IrrE family metallo-endopeptidase [Ruminiclostridium sp.]|nr:ImmA/IrrE family metallo-endopeptidase [Ruminiclostridium sp.]
MMYLTRNKKQKIREKVSNLLTYYNLGSSNHDNIDIVKFAGAVGFRVGESKKLLDIEDGFIFISESRKEYLIGVNYNRTLEEKRFIVAYELAHYFLHYDENSKVNYLHRKYIKRKKEKENDTDFFAKCIMKPE